MVKRILTRSVLRMTRDCPWSRAIIFRHGAPPRARRRVSFPGDPLLGVVHQRRRHPPRRDDTATLMIDDDGGGGGGDELLRLRVRYLVHSVARTSKSSASTRRACDACDTVHAGSRAITRARGGRGRSSESMTGTRRNDTLRCVVRCTERCQARAWIACAAPGRDEKSHRAVCRRQRARPARRRENSRAEIQSVPAREFPSAPSCSGK